MSIMRGTIVTTCDMQALNSDEYPPSSTLSIALSEKDATRTTFLVNNNVRCSNVSHELGLAALCSVMEVPLAVRLTTINLEQSTLRIEFDIYPWYCLPKHFKFIAPYCGSPEYNPLNLPAAAPTYEIADVFAQATRTSPSRVTVASGLFSLIAQEIVEEALVPYLCAKDLRYLRLTCKYLWDVGACIVPGLVPKLFRHQKTSLGFMEQQEQCPADLTDIYHFRIGQQCWVDATSGSANETGLANENFRARRGGLLCDAPGLGKTVAVLSLILRTRGMLPLQITMSSSPVKPSTKRSTPVRVAKALMQDKLNNLPSTKTTLVVIPKPLVSHWEKQMQLHVKPGELSYRVVDQGDSFPFGDELVRTDILLVTVQRMSQEERNADSVLRQFIFLRCIVDEGHSLGSSGQTTNYASLLRAIRSERFWIMSGTPAKLSNTIEGLQSLRGILGFLQACPDSNATWAELILRGFRQKNHPVSFHRLIAILKRVLIRHVKADVVGDLPELVREEVVLELSEAEKMHYNILVSFVRSNVVLTSIGHVSGWDLSLLNPIHRKSAQELIYNLRMACCSGSVEGFRLALSNANLQDTEELFKTEPMDVRQRVRNYISQQSVNGVNVPCGGCSKALPYMVLTRCGHFFCVDCLTVMTERKALICPVCLTVMDADDLAQLQPGFSLRRWVLPDATDRGTKSNYILNRIVQERSSSSTKAKFIVFSQFRSVMNVVGDRLISAFGQDAVAEFWGKYRDSELNKFVNGNVEEWRCTKCSRVNTDLFATTCGLPTVVVRVLPQGEERTIYQPETSIIGWNAAAPAQNWTGTPVQLTDGSNGVIIMSGPCRNKRKFCPSVTRKVDCDILLLSKDGSHGLDISCATHLFLLEAVWEPALEDQIVSRAWRLGNKSKQVKVEQLIMRNTCEEILVDLQQQQQHQQSRNANSADTLDDEKDKSQQQQQNDPRIKLLLERIRLV